MENGKPKAQKAATRKHVTLLNYTDNMTPNEYKAFRSACKKAGMVKTDIYSNNEHIRSSWTLIVFSKLLNVPVEELLGLELNMKIEPLKNKTP